MTSYENMKFTVYHADSGQPKRILWAQVWGQTRPSILLKGMIFIKSEQSASSPIGQCWATNFPKGPHDKLGMLWRAA